MRVQTAYSLLDTAREQTIYELRKFFNPDDAYYKTVLPPNFWNDYTDLIYTEKAPGEPTGTLQIVDQFNLDDEKLPSLILTGSNGAMRPAGFGQAGQKPPITVEILPTNVTPVNAATTLEQNFNTDFVAGKTIDGYVLQLGDRILIKDQADATQNGPYVVQASGAPIRTTDFNTSAQFIQYTVIPVISGKIHAGTQLIQVTAQPISLGITKIDYSIPQFQEYVEVSEPSITFGVRASSTSQRDRLVDLLMLCISNKFMVRGQLQKQDIIFQPTNPGFIRLNSTSEEDVMQGAAYPKIYKAELSSTLWLQWNYRVLQTELVAGQVNSVAQNY